MLARISSIFAAAILAVSAIAQGDTAPKVELKLDKTSAVVGSTLKGKVVITFADGLHAYQNPPTEDFQIPVEVTAAKGTTLTKKTYPKGEPFMLPGETKASMVYSGTIQIPVEIKVGAKPGATILKLVIKYQQCNDTACFPPSQVEASAKVTLAPVPKPAKKGTTAVKCKCCGK